VRVVYVAGPFRGATPWDVEQNVRRAEAAALEVWKAGATALCLHANTRHFDKLCADELWISGTQELLARCDAIYMTGDWPSSRGSVAELRSALLKGMPVFLEQPGSLWAWLAEQDECPGGLHGLFHAGGFVELRSWAATGIAPRAELADEWRTVRSPAVAELIRKAGHMPAAAMDPMRRREALVRITDLCGGDEDMDCVAGVAQAALDGRELP